MTATAANYVSTLPTPRATLKQLNAAIDEMPVAYLATMVAGLAIALERAKTRLNDELREGG